MFYFLAIAVPLSGAIIHVLVDRKPKRRTSPRVVELFLVWILAGGGVMSILGGVGHIGPNSTDLAEDIGFEQSFFQWEVGWSDIALGTIGFLCIWKRGSFMTAAVIVLLIQYGGDAIGHVMQWVEHDNTEPGNIYSIPSDTLLPIAAAILLYVHRRNEKAGRIGQQSAPATAVA